MPNLNNTSFAPMLKTLWYSKELQDLALKNNPFLGMVPKQTEFTGDSMKLPLSYADLQGRSASFQDAQANLQPSKYAAFLITRVNDYAVGRIDGETIETAKGNKGAFMNAVEAEVKRGKNSITRSLAVSQYRTSEGSIATVSAAGATTFDIPTAEGYNIEVGMNLNVVNSVSNALRFGAMLVTGINRTFSSTLARVTVNAIVAGTVATDRIVCVGDFGSKTSGLADWIPDAAPTSAPFFGVDRTADVQRLGGLRTASSAPIEEALQDALSQQFAAGGRPDYGFINPIDMGNLINSLGAKVQRTKLMGTSGTGYSGVLIDSPAGEIKMVPDVNCPRRKIYLLQMDTWTYASAGDAPHILDYGDGSSLRVGNQDAMEFRMGYRGQLMCSAPGYNQVLILL
jgi:hypothetical protein